MSVEFCNIDCPFLVGGKCMAYGLGIEALAQHVDAAPRCDEYESTLYAATAQAHCGRNTTCCRKENDSKGGRGEVC